MAQDNFVPDTPHDNFVPDVPDNFVPDAPAQSAQPQSLSDKLMQTWPVRAAKSVYDAVTLPGDVATGNVNVAPSKPGMWSDEDEARLQATNSEIANRASNLATVSSPLSAATRAGEGIFGVPITPKQIPLPAAGPFGVTLSKGEEANNLALRQAEQAAIRGGDKHGQQWIAQRQEQIQQANKNVVQGLDPLGQQTIAGTPQEAGEYVSQGVQGAAKISKAAVKTAYETAEGLGGNIHAGVFENIGNRIKQEIFPNVNVNAQTTPIANQMVDYLDNLPSNFTKLNKADPFGSPNPENITDVSLKGVDETRKILSKWRGDAFKPIPDADTRATQSVLDAFDNRIDQAVNGGMFTGDKSAVNAWNNARAANADYRSTFTPGKNDPVGRVVQKIIGDKINDPLTSGKVMDQIVGSSGVNPSSLNIGVANRLKSILGENSPEWIAAKQGLANRLVQTGEGESALSTGQVAQRLSKFLNSDMAGVMYSPQEQATLRSYANLMRQITMPPGSYFPSAPGIQKIVSVVANRIGAVIGGLVGRVLLPLMPIVGELGGLTVGSQVEKALERAHNNVAKQLPLVSQQMRQWQKAVAVANKTSSPTSSAAVRTATTNLSGSLKQFGIDFGGLLQSPVRAPAEQNQQKIPGEPGQQNNGGRIDQQNGFAHGGRVKLSHEKVAYITQSHKRSKKCSNCLMYIRENECVLVRAPISPDGLCRRFRMKK